MNSLTAITLSLLLALTYCQRCQSRKDKDLLQTGYIVLFEIDGQKEGVNFTVPLDFTIQSETYLAVSGVYYMDSPNPNFEIRISKRNDSTILLSVRSNGEWRIVQIQYLASALQNIKAGSFEAVLHQQTPVKPQNVILQHPTGIKSSEKYEIVTFVSGLMGRNISSLDLQLSQPIFNNTNGVITIKALTRIQVIQINYVIWKARLGFTFSVNEVLLYSDWNRYQFYGNYSQNATGDLVIEIKRIRCKGKACHGSCLTYEKCVAQKAKLLDETCYACIENEIIQDGKCVCNIGHFVDSNAFCVPICSVSGHEVYNQDRQCVCDRGYERREGSCQKCEQGKQCNVQCKANSYYDGQSCSCKPGYFINSLRKCELICEGKETLNQTGCTCPPGYTKQEGICLNGNQKWCRTGFQLNEQTGQCDPNCSVNQIFDGQKCVCKSGYVVNGESCRKCPTGTFVMDGLCVCESDFQFNEETNQCDPICGANQEVYDQHCVCKPRYVQIRGLCVLECSEPHQVWSSTGCECDKGFYMKGESCFECSAEVNSSECSAPISQSTQITITDTARRNQKVIQNVKLNYIPDKLTQNQCALCSDILMVYVNANWAPEIHINFVPGTNYEFQIELDFIVNLAKVQPFYIFIQLNSKYSKYFSEDDLSLTKIQEINPTALSRRLLQTGRFETASSSRLPRLTWDGIQ